MMHMCGPHGFASVPQPYTAFLSRSQWSSVMKKVSLFSLLFLLLGAGSPLAQDVRYNFDKQADFTKFKTYKFVALKDAAPLNDLVDKQIKSAIESQLSQKGLTKVDGDDADLYIGYQGNVGQEKEFTSYSTGWGYGPGWGR